MTMQRPSIALLDAGGDGAAPICAALEGISGATVRPFHETFTQMNGSATTLLQGHDVVMFRVGSDVDGDAETLRALRGAVPKETGVLAICRPDISLGEIRRLTASGVTEVLPDTATAEEIEAQVRAVIARAAPKPATAETPARRGQVLAVARTRGGVGASTLAVNLADQLLDRRGSFRKTAQNKVVIVDLDLQFGAVASLLDVEPTDAIYTMVLEGITPDAHFVDQALVEAKSGIFVLPAPASFLPLEALQGGQVGKLIDTLAERFDHVILDLPRALVDWLSPVLERTDRMLLVTDSAVPSIRQGKRLIDAFTADKLQLDITVVVNSEKRPVLPKRHHTEAARVLERPFRHWIPQDARSAREASDRGEPLSRVSNRSAMTKAIRRLAREMTQLSQTSAPAKK